jgi:hypothetical protein
VSSNLDQDGAQHYVIKFVSDLQQVGGFLQVLRFPPSVLKVWTYIIAGITTHPIAHTGILVMISV